MTYYVSSGTLNPTHSLTHWPFYAVQAGSGNAKFHPPTSNGGFIRRTTAVPSTHCQRIKSSTSRKH